MLFKIAWSEFKGPFVQIYLFLTQRSRKLGMLPGWDFFFLGFLLFIVFTSIGTTHLFRDVLISAQIKKHIGQVGDYIPIWAKLTMHRDLEKEYQKLFSYHPGVLTFPYFADKISQKAEKKATSKFMLGNNFKPSSWPQQSKVHFYTNNDPIFKSFLKPRISPLEVILNRNVLGNEIEVNLEGFENNYGFSPLKNSPTQPSAPGFSKVKLDDLKWFEIVLKIPYRINRHKAYILRSYPLKIAEVVNLVGQIQPTAVLSFKLHRILEIRQRGMTLYGNEFRLFLPELFPSDNSLSNDDFLDYIELSQTNENWRSKILTYLYKKDIPVDEQDNKITFLVPPHKKLFKDCKWCDQNFQKKLHYVQMGKITVDEHEKSTSYLYKDFEVGLKESNDIYIYYPWEQRNRLATFLKSLSQLSSKLDINDSRIVMDEAYENSLGTLLSLIEKIENATNVITKVIYYLNIILVSGFAFFIVYKRKKDFSLLLSNGYNSSSINLNIFSLYFISCLFSLLLSSIIMIPMKVFLSKVIEENISGILPLLYSVIEGIRNKNTFDIDINILLSLTYDAIIILMVLFLSSLFYVSKMKITLKGSLDYHLGT